MTVEETAAAGNEAQSPQVETPARERKSAAWWDDFWRRPLTSTGRALTCRRTAEEALRLLGPELQRLGAGQRLRVAVARALVAGPEILLADEPTAALDPETAHQVMDLIQQSCRANGATLIVASHDTTLAERFQRRCDLRDHALYETLSATPDRPL